VSFLARTGVVCGLKSLYAVSISQVRLRIEQQFLPARTYKEAPEGIGMSAPVYAGCRFQSQPARTACRAARAAETSGTSEHAEFSNRIVPQIVEGTASGSCNVAGDYSHMALLYSINSFCELFELAYD
jgi:hypothetical protein